MIFYKPKEKLSRKKFASIFGTGEVAFAFGNKKHNLRHRTAQLKAFNKYSHLIN
jgi:hypothetical protein